MKSNLLLLVFFWGVAFFLPGFTAAKGLWNVRDHGVRGDGKTLDTTPINKTIQAAADAGGGTVYFPPGTYLSGSICLKSFITLHLEAGATLLGAPNDISAYDPPR